MFQKTGANLLHISVTDHRSIYLLDACTQNGVQTFDPPIVYDSIKRPYMELFQTENDMLVGANADTALHYMLSLPDAAILLLTDAETEKSVLRLLLNQTEDRPRDYIIVLPTMGTENCAAAARLIQEAACGRKILQRIVNYAQNNCPGTMHDKLKIYPNAFTGIALDILAKQDYRNILTDPIHTGTISILSTDKQNILDSLLRSNIPLNTPMWITVRAGKQANSVMSGMALETWECGLKFKPDGTQPEQLIAYSIIQDFEILNEQKDAAQSDTDARAILLRKDHGMPLTSEEIIRMAELLELGHDSSFEQVTIEGMYDTALGFIKTEHPEKRADFNVEAYEDQVRQILNQTDAENVRRSILGVDTLLTTKLP